MKEGGGVWFELFSIPFKDKILALYIYFEYFPKSLLGKDVTCIWIRLCSVCQRTGAKPTLGPNCMIPYYIWYHTVLIQSGLSPCVLTKKKIQTEN